LTFGGQARQKVNHGGQAAHHRRMLRQSRSDAFGKRRRMEKNRKIKAGKPAKRWIMAGGACSGMAAKGENEKRRSSQERGLTYSLFSEFSCF